PFVGDVLGTRPGAAPARLTRYLDDPVLAEQELGGGRAERRFEDAYRRMVLSPGACSAYAALVQTAADDGTHPLLFHCTAGKDRTGWGAAVLLLLLGAGEDAVRREYLAVNDAVRARYEPYVRRFVERGGDPEIAAVLTEVRPAYLDAALDALTERWGDIERYAREALRVEAALDRLRAELTV
ncbi:tyrosine-protein phosphatase, partial [Streptomyces sp. KAI-27]|nr:tyrosine-protein phosphatase [Streptomyces sp. KAI-27]